MQTVVLIWLLLINLVAVIATVRDKRAAKRGRRRTRESTLLWIAALGGALGMLLTMYVVCHKTRKPAFAIGVPLLLLTHLAVAVALWLWQSGLLAA